MFPMKAANWRRRIRELIDTLGGGTMTLTGGGHIRIDLNIGGGPVFTSSTPSDRRALDNLRALLRRVHRLAQAKGPMIV